MRGIKIDSVMKTVEEVDVKTPNSSLQGLYDLIGCEMIELVSLASDIVLVCDEEAKLKKIAGAFVLRGTNLVIAGNAVLLGGGGDRFQKFTGKAEDVRNSVEWIDPADVPEPQFKFYSIG